MDEGATIDTYAAKIDEIEQGGGDTLTPEVERKNLNFYDYDGTRLHSYTWEDAMEMTELPPLPTQKGLVCQGWNYSLEDIKAQNGACDVGATYITDDGKTRLYLTIDSERAKDIWLYLSGDIEVDWGDGTIESHNGTTLKLNHKYSKYGDYVASIAAKSGVLSFRAYTTYNIMGDFLAPSSERINTLRKVEIGGSVTSIGGYAFQTCTSLQSISIPNSVTSIVNYAFQYCASLQSVVIPDSVTSVEVYALYNCPSLQIVIMPNSVTSIRVYALYNLYSIAYIDFSLCNTIPTLSSSVSIGNLNAGTKIIVPDNLYDEWIVATNWTGLASKIVKNSEYTRPL